MFSGFQGRCTRNTIRFFTDIKQFIILIFSKITFQDIQKNDKYTLYLCPERQ